MSEDGRRWADSINQRVQTVEAREHKVDGLEARYHELMRDNTTLASQIASLARTLESFKESLGEVTYLVLKHERRIDNAERISALPIETHPPFDLGRHDDEKARPEQDPPDGDEASGTGDGGDAGAGAGTEGGDGSGSRGGSGPRAEPPPAGPDGADEDDGQPSAPLVCGPARPEVQPRLATTTSGDVAGGGSV